MIPLQAKKINVFFACKSQWERMPFPVAQTAASVASATCTPCVRPVSDLGKRHIFDIRELFRDRNAGEGVRRQRKPPPLFSRHWLDFFPADPLTLRQFYVHSEEPEGRIAALRHFLPGIRELLLAERLDARNEGIARAVGRMAELELRHPVLHPEARNLEVVIGLRWIDAQHEALPDLAAVRRRPLKRCRLVSTCRRNYIVMRIDPFDRHNHALPFTNIDRDIGRNPRNSANPRAIFAAGIAIILGIDPTHGMRYHR